MHNDACSIDFTILAVGEGLTEEIIDCVRDFSILVVDDLTLLFVTYNDSSGFVKSTQKRQPIGMQRYHLSRSERVTK